MGRIENTSNSCVDTELVRKAINNQHSIIERDKWGTKKPKANLLVPDWNFTAIALHHSGNAGAKDPGRIESLHMTKNGYDDVGYHYMVHPKGTIYEGRKIYHKGSHVSAANTGKIGILLMGDYDEQALDFDDDELSNTHLLALQGLITTLKRQFPTIKKLGGHKEFLPGKNYSCPGNVIMAKVNQVRKYHGLTKP